MGRFAPSCIVLALVALFILSAEGRDFPRLPANNAGALTRSFAFSSPYASVSATGAVAADLSSSKPEVTRATGTSTATGDIVRVDGFNQVTDRTAASVNLGVAIDLPGVGGDGAQTTSKSSACTGSATKCPKP